MSSPFLKGTVYETISRIHIAQGSDWRRGNLKMAVKLWFRQKLGIIWPDERLLASWNWSLLWTNSCPQILKRYCKPFKNSKSRMTSHQTVIQLVLQIESSFIALDIQSIYTNRCETRDRWATCGYPNLFIYAARESLGKPSTYAPSS
jgi:hypothetical protein